MIAIKKLTFQDLINFIGGYWLFIRPWVIFVLPYCIKVNDFSYLFSPPAHFVAILGAFQYAINPNAFYSWW